jgi:hypothetical protein
VFPSFDAAGWAPTKKHLHLVAQMLGKLRLALAPAQPNWTFAALALDARGFTTGPMPWNGGAVQASVDVFTSEIVIELSDGRSARIDLRPARTIADVFAAFTRALEALGVTVHISPVPQELADLTPFDQDDRPTSYDPVAVQRWFSIAMTTAGIFERWRSHFFGRSGIYLWWGAFDVSMMLFTGKHVPPPTDRGYLLQYDLDAEMLNVGFYPGDESNARAMFYGYVYPEPPNCERTDLGHGDVFWSTQLREWILPYEAVRLAPDPAASLTRFLDGVYDVCATGAGWDRNALSYIAPPRVRA